MGDCYAVLLDTVSIQNYIFRSNKLRENLGSSYLVQEIYRKYLIKALCKVTGRTFEEERQHLNDWKNSDADRPYCTEPVDVGYIGGGNALLFFQKESQAKEFIENWTKFLLVYTPGLTTAVAYSNFPQNPKQFNQALKSLFNNLKENKNRYIPVTSLPRHGITAECARSELSAEIYNKKIEEHISADVNARICAASLSKIEIGKKYHALLGDNYCFSNELDDLGGIRGEDGHIAVVHIDGNEVGRLFKEAANLKVIRGYSKTIGIATETAFDKVVETTMNKYEDIMNSLGFQADVNIPTEQGGKKILPIRPVILGGDDVTFVCDGRLGIYLAGIFIEEFEKTRINGEKLTACAGIAIIKTRYPFYRGYRLAEELCVNAKTRRKDENDSASFLDFLVSMGGIAGSLTNIRKRYFGYNPTRENPQETLLYRPFKVVPKEPFDESGLEMFLAKAWELQRFPKNKLADLRNVLTLSKAARQEFVQSLKYRELTLPRIEGHQYEDALFENNITPYFDMLEILRFYPDFALKEIGEKNETI